MASRQEKGNLCRGTGCFRAEMRRYRETRRYPYGAWSSSDFRLQEAGVDIFGETNAVLADLWNMVFYVKNTRRWFYIFLKLARETSFWRARITNTIYISPKIFEANPYCFSPAPALVLLLGNH